MIGCGIVGATIARVFRAQGRKVLVLDDCRQMNGTAPSGGHCKPGWFAGMPKDQYEPAMELLAEVWDLLDETFVIRPGGLKTTVYRVDTEVVVREPRTKATVMEIVDLKASKPTIVYKQDGETKEVQGSLVILATGHWVPELFRFIKVTDKQGVSFRFNGQVTPFIDTWAPYKQVVVHQQGPNEIWIGDGSAILAKNWSDRTKQCLTRCRTKLGPKFKDAEPIRTITGIRPYCEKQGKDPCLLKKVGPSTWVATGSGKLGTVSAGWCAWRLLNAET